MNKKNKQTKNKENVNCYYQVILMIHLFIFFYLVQFVLVVEVVHHDPIVQYNPLTLFYALRLHTITLTNIYLSKRI